MDEGGHGSTTAGYTTTQPHRRATVTAHTIPLRGFATAAVPVANTTNTTPVAPTPKPLSLNAALNATIRRELKRRELQRNAPLGPVRLMGSENMSQVPERLLASDSASLGPLSNIPSGEAVRWNVCQQDTTSSSESDVSDSSNESDSFQPFSVHAPGSTTHAGPALLPCPFSAEDAFDRR